MNQILVTNPDMGHSPEPNPHGKKSEKQKKNNGPAKISSVIKFFAVLIILIGGTFVGYTAYNKYMNEQNYVSVPTISHTKIDEKTLLVTVEHDSELDRIIYNWNNEQSEIVYATGELKSEVEIQIPEGTNNLLVTVVDKNGQSASMEQEFIVSESIGFSIVDGQVMISINSSVEVEYMTYKWNLEEEETVEIGQNIFEHIIDIPKGLNILYVMTVDVNGQIKDKEQQVEGVLKPTLDVSLDELQENIIFMMTDETALASIHILVNGTEEYLEETQNAEFEYQLPVEILEQGSNELIVTVTNSKGIENELIINVNK